MRVQRRVTNRAADYLYRAHSRLAIPTNVGLALTYKCNIRCPYCMREQYTPDRAEMSLGDVQRIVRRMPYVSGVCVMGLCEPFLNPATPEILRWIKDEAGLSISFTTNGMVELTSDRLDSLLRVDDFVFSMDTSDPETFQILRGGAKLPVVWGNFQRLLDYKRERGLGRMDNPPIHINAVVTSRNFTQIPSLIHMLEPYANDLTYLMVDPVTRPDFQHFEEPLMLQENVFRKHIDEYRALAAESPLQVVGFDYMFETSSEWRSCTMSWQGMFVHSNGDAYFCYDYDYKLGNVLREDPLKIWNSPKARAFRAALQTDQPPLDQCRTCNFARSGWQNEGVYNEGKQDVLSDPVLGTATPQTGDPASIS